VDDGLAETRARAQALVLTGDVLVDDVPVTKAGTRVRPESRVRVRGGGSRYVSRGGDKLAGALADLAPQGLDPRGLHCLDVGASTGGFTDCLLQAGAASVVAVDVGYGQLHPRLRDDPRVLVRERTNARDLEAAALPHAIDLAVFDASFISLRLLLAPVAAVAPRAQVLALVKPQFEVGRERVGKGGVVRDDAERAAAVDAVAAAAAALGYRERARVDSRVHGPKGNREIFLWLAPARADGGPTAPRAGGAGC
ncbi:MAG: TlyA family RNA methyltransferase, partial [Myxococcales bacterium]|nr:TlyA family RNA methyltransferase [Myxococcales bacterium]